MSDNGMMTLRCGIEDHGDMDRLFEDPRPLTAAFSLWICQACGTMAVHLETPGDIYWYNAQSKTRTTDEPGAPRTSLMGPVFGNPSATEVHHAGCAYCPNKFPCSCGSPWVGHVCPRCDATAEESKMEGDHMGGVLAPRVWPTPDPGEAAQDRAQTDAF